MTEKRFTMIYFESDGNLIFDENKRDKNDEWYNSANCLKDNEIHDLLNSFNNENEQLKQSYSTLKHRHSTLHDELLDVECERDGLKKDVDSLEKENEELKKRIEWFKEVIDRNGFKVKE